MTNAKTTAKPSAKVTNAQAAEVKVVSKKALAKPVVATKATAAVEAAKVKNKLIRDSFTIPKSEYEMLDALKVRAVTLARPAKKSEVLRAGIAALAGMSDKAFLAALGSVPALKTGRPKGK